MNSQFILWLAFGILVGGALIIDLGVFHRKAHVVRSREALTWTIVWVALAMIFNLGVYWLYGPVVAGEFLAGYLIEKSLSVDNLFVFLVIFAYFHVPKEYEARILIWGIVGAIILRAVFIVVGSALLKQFHWMIYVFGGFLVLTGFKLLLKQEGGDPGKNPVLWLARRLFTVSDKLEGQKFFTRLDGKLVATPLFIVLLVIETTDVIFAVDSIPAIFAVTTDPFIVLTSNIFAILGLRSLYFLLAQAAEVFKFLKYGLVLILWFVGAKMMLSDTFKIPIKYSLLTIGSILALSILWSVLYAKTNPSPPAPPPDAQKQ